MAGYRFESVWVIEAPATEAFDALRRFEEHPRWWRHVECANQSAAHAVRYEIRSPLWYSLTFDVALQRAVRPSLIATTATGDLAGSGIWVLRDLGGVTTLNHRWQVATTRPWMNAAAPLADPLFRWAHDRVMEGGARGLAEILGARLLAVA
jgi:uncharacterized membrane protein